MQYSQRRTLDSQTLPAKAALPRHTPRTTNPGLRRPRETYAITVPDAAPLRTPPGELGVFLGRHKRSCSICHNRTVRRSSRKLRARESHGSCHRFAFAQALPLPIMFAFYSLTVKLLFCPGRIGKQSPGRARNSITLRLVFMLASNSVARGVSGRIATARRGEALHPGKRQRAYLGRSLQGRDHFARALPPGLLPDVCRKA